MSDHSKARDDLLRQADEARARLLHTVEQLDQRRNDALDIRLQLQRHLRQLAFAGGVLVVGAAGVVAWSVHRIATAPDRRRRDRWRLAQHVWRHPDRALRGERRSLLGQLARGWLLSTATAALTYASKRAAAPLWERGRVRFPTLSAGITDAWQAATDQARRMAETLRDRGPRTGARAELGPERKASLVPPF